MCGEIADAMVNGDLCEWCGIYLGEGAGYPRLCRGCKDTVEGRKREADAIVPFGGDRRYDARREEE